MNPTLNEDIELWKPIEVCPKYEISTLGRVRNTRSECIRVPDKNSKGYARLRILKDGKKIRFMIHRCVALAFLPNPENKEMVDHINGDNTDNRLVNLRWSTRSENQLNGKVRKDKKHTTLRNVIKNGNWYRWRVCVRGQIHTSQNFTNEQEAYTDFLTKCTDLSNFIRLHQQPNNILVL